MNSASRKCQMRKIKCQFALTKRQEGREVRKVRREMRQNTFSKCKRRNVASLRRCVVVAIKCLASSLPTPAPSGVEVSGSSSGSNSVAATNNAQIWRNATQRNASNRLPIHFNSLCFDLFITCRWKLKLHFAAASFCVFYFCFHFLFVFYFSFAFPTAAFHCALLFAVVFLLLSLFLGLCFAVIGAIAPGNHCQQLMKAIVGVAAF